ncbi:ATP-binding protein [Simonsiella muelleri]|uniref:ATP-binding protein n=1 Tax=Simonsiella muelleri TaxID=72 RepID=UPI0023F45EC6|nr:ATP-binding protein [Simonsiella muelleri]
MAVSSLKRRLIVPLGAGFTIIWLAACIGGAINIVSEINDAEDSRMQQLAHTLMLISDRLPQYTNAITHDDDDNGFAIWHHDKLLLADSEGEHIPFQTASTTKDSHQWWQPNAWRYIYLHDAQTHFTVAVSQRWEERYESMYDNIWLQFILLLIALPIILGLIWHSIYRGLQPLNLLAKQLQQRQGNHLTPISENVPAETLPLVQSFNRLLERASIAMQRERRFSADAAHELRSPLAALKIQTEVLAMSETAEEREHHIQQIINSLERASHLTDQLLILSRLDPMDTLPETEPLNWDNLARQSLSLVNPSAREKHIRLKYEAHSGSLKLPKFGSPLLVQLMLRNLLDNAIKYSPEYTTVTLQIHETAISVTDEGKGIAIEHMAHIRDRFYRPAGQTQNGSGLGLSIVETAATLHNMSLNLKNLPTHGLCAELTLLMP